MPRIRLFNGQHQFLFHIWLLMIILVTFLWSFGMELGATEYGVQGNGLKELHTHLNGPLALWLVT